MGDLVRDFAPHELVELSDAELDTVGGGQTSLVNVVFNLTSAAVANATSGTATAATNGSATTGDATATAVAFNEVEIG